MDRKIAVISYQQVLFTNEGGSFDVVGFDWRILLRTITRYPLLVKSDKEPAAVISTIASWRLVGRPIMCRTVLETKLRFSTDSSMTLTASPKEKSSSRPFLIFWRALGKQRRKRYVITGWKLLLWLPAKWDAPCVCARCRPIDIFIRQHSAMILTSHSSLAAVCASQRQQHKGESKK